MSDSLVTSAVTVLLAIIGVAFLAVLVSKNANTSGVLSGASQGFATDLNTALSPLSGSLGLSFGSSGAI